MKTIIRIILFILMIIFFGYLDHKYHTDIEIDQTTVDIVMDQQVIDTYYK